MTLVLISMSYSLNYLPIGAAIVIVCDGTDILVKLVKASVDVIPMTYTIALWALLTISWGVFRIYYFFWWVIRVMYLQVSQSEHKA